MLLNGQGVKKDLKLGLEWLREASIRGSNKATVKLAEILSQETIESSLAEAFDLYLKACQNGDVNSL